MPIFTESKTRFWGEGSDTILKWATNGSEGAFFERIFGCENRDVPEDWLESKSDSYRLCNMGCKVRKERDGSISLFMNTIRIIPVGAFEKIASLFPKLHADGIFIQQTEEFFGSYVIENGHFLWTQFHNPGRRSGQRNFRFEDFFADDYCDVDDPIQNSVLHVMDLERRLLRGDSTARAEMKSLLREFVDEKNQKASIGFFFSKLEKKALCGDKDAQYKLYEEIDSGDYYDDKNIYYRNDEVYDQDWELMKESWLHKAAMNGHADAQFEMAIHCYCNDNPSVAKEWFKASLKNNCVQAFESWSEYFCDNAYGDDQPFIDEEILSCLEKQADKSSSVLLMKSLADYYQEVQVNSQKEEYWRGRASATGDLSALEEFASFQYRNGSTTTAIELYKQAIAMGSVAAPQALARIYESQKAKSEREKSIALLELAGNRGASEAYFELACKYALGIVVKKDCSKAFEYLMKSYNADGNIDAAIYIWLCLEAGVNAFKSLKVNKTDLLHEFEDDVDYMYFIAQCYNGEDEMACSFGIKKDKKKYVYWLKKASEGDESAMFTLGTLYYEGTVVKQDYKRAFELFLKHANDAEGFRYLNGEYSQYYLGLMYQNGCYVSQNLFMAKKWLEISAKAGDEKSKEALKDVKALIKARKLKPQTASICAAESFENGVYNMYEGMFRNAVNDLKTLGTYNDAQQRLEKCLKELNISVADWNEQNEEVYRRADYMLTHREYADARDLFATIFGWKDSAKKHEQALELANNEIYEAAMQLIKVGDLAEAKKKLKSLDDWRDSKAILKDLSKFGYEKLISNANEFIENRKYKKALNELVVARDSDYKAKDVERIEKDISYCNAFIAIDKKEFEKAQEVFEYLGDWRDSKEQLAEAIEISNEWRYNRALYFMDNKEYEKAREVLSEITGWKDSQDLINLCNSKMESHN